MKLCVVTANIGGIDEQCTHNVTCPVHYFTEEQLPKPLIGTSPRHAGKYLKIMTHAVLPDYDGYIWVDGSVRLITNAFVELAVTALSTTSLLLVKHPRRTNVYAELDFIVANLTDPYLSVRYGGDDFERERRFYRRRGLPDTVCLYAGYIFARRNDKATNKLFSNWWHMLQHFTRADQSKLAYLVWKYAPSVSVMDNETVMGPMAIRHKHKKCV